MRVNPAYVLGVNGGPDRCVLAATGGGEEKTQEERWPYESHEEMHSKRHANRCAADFPLAEATRSRHICRALECIAGAEVSGPLAAPAETS